MSVYFCWTNNCKYWYAVVRLLKLKTQTDIQTHMKTNIQEELEKKLISVF